MATVKILPSVTISQDLGVYLRAALIPGEAERIASLVAAALATPDQSAAIKLLREALERAAAALDSMNRNIGAASLSRNALGIAIRAEAEIALTGARQALAATQGDVG